MQTSSNIIISNFKCKLKNSIKYLVVIFFGLTTVYPLIWVLLCSFKDNSDIFANPFSLPKLWRIENYIKVWNTSHINISFINSLIVSVSTILLTLIVCSMAAFVITRIKFKYNFTIFSFLLLGLMIPQSSALVPLFILYNKIGILNNYLALIISYTSFGISGSLFMISGFMKTIPNALEESAIVDGCSAVRVFISIILPLSRTVLVTVAILSFLNSWNEYLFALVFISNPLIKTLTQALAGFKSAHVIYYGLMSSGIVISVIPVILVYIFLQEQVIKGMTAGAVKG